MTVFKVGGKSLPGKLAGAIAGAINEGTYDLRLECIGAGAVNNAVKGVATARGYVATAGKDILIKPFFSDVFIDEEEKTAIMLSLVVMEA